MRMNLMFRWHFLIHCSEQNAHTHILHPASAQKQRECKLQTKRCVRTYTVQVNNRICPLAMTEMNKRFHPHCLFSEHATDSQSQSKSERARASENEQTENSFVAHSTDFAVNKYKCTLQLVYSKIFYSIFFCLYANTTTDANTNTRIDSCVHTAHALWLIQSSSRYANTHTNSECDATRWTNSFTYSPTQWRAFSYFSSQFLSSLSLNFIDELYLSWIKWFILIDFISLMRMQNVCVRAYEAPLIQLFFSCSITLGWIFGINHTIYAMLASQNTFQQGIHALPVCLMVVAQNLAIQFLIFASIQLHIWRWKLSLFAAPYHRWMEMENDVCASMYSTGCSNITKDTQIEPVNACQMRVLFLNFRCKKTHEPEPD